MSANKKIDTDMLPYREREDIQLRDHDEKVELPFRAPTSTPESGSIRGKEKSKTVRMEYVVKDLPLY